MRSIVPIFVPKLSYYHLKRSLCSVWL